MRRTRSWNSSPPRLPQRPPQPSFMSVVLPPPRALSSRRLGHCPAGGPSHRPYARPQCRRRRSRRHPLPPRLAASPLIRLPRWPADRLCIPEAGGLRLQVLQELHSTPLGGHFGRSKTLALACRSVWWPGLSAEVEEYIRTCPTCQRVKADHLLPAGLLFPLPMLTRLGGCVSLDFIELQRPGRATTLCRCTSTC